MKKAIYTTISILIVLFIIPCVINRIKYEETYKTYVMSINLTQISNQYKSKDLEQVLSDYKKSGVTTAVIYEKNGIYPKHLLNIATRCGMNIALVPDTTVETDANIHDIISNYDVEYIKIKEGTNNKNKNIFLTKQIYNVTNEINYKSPHKNIGNDSKYISNFIDKYDIGYKKFLREASKVKLNNVFKSNIIYEQIKNNNITVVITESIMQLSNQHPYNYQNYLYASQGNILRAFDTYKKTNIKKIDYNESYYQMYYAIYDRNASFIMVNQITDDEFTKEENALRTQNSISAFCKKMKELGYKSEQKINYQNHKINRRLISSVVAIISALMLFVLIEKAFITNKTKIFLTLIMLSIGVSIITYLIPCKFLIYYPTIFALISPCFCIAILQDFIEKNSNKLSFYKLSIFSAIITLILFFICGLIMSSILSGADYYLNENIFKGVKITLVMPILFKIFFIMKNENILFMINKYKKTIITDIKKVPKYYIFIVFIMLIIVFIYIRRSGNVSSISYREIYFRNYLAEFFSSRPRTKDFIIGWPFLLLYIYYYKNKLGKFFTYIFAIGSSILFASNINTFCHVFTSTKVMFLRVIYGCLLGCIISLVFLAVNKIYIKVFKIKNNE